MIPVVCVHFGKPKSFVTHSLNTAALFRNDVHFIGDVKLNGNFISHSIDDYHEGLSKFQQVFKPNGPHSPEFRFWSSGRWFVFYEFMEKNNAKWMMAIDSDVMLFESAMKAAEVIPQGTQFSYSFMDGCATIGQSFWFSRSALKKMCDLTMKMYEGVKPKQKEHVSDMSVATKLVKSGQFESFDTRPLRGHGRFDHNNLSSEHGKYKMENDGRVKELMWHKGLPYAYDNEQKKWFRFSTIHCSGSKHRVERYFTYARDKVCSRGEAGRLFVPDDSSDGEAVQAENDS